MKKTILFLASLLILNCGNPSTPESGGTVKAVRDQLKIGSRRAPDSLHPYVTTSPAGETIIPLLFPSLFRELPTFSKGLPKMEPYIVEATEFSDDKLTITLTLKPQLKWSDGTDLTAEDVAYTLQVQKDPTVAWPHSDRKQHIQNWQVLEPLKIAVTFSKYSPYNLLDLNEGVLIPKHFFSQIPVPDWKKDWGPEMVVYGPYKISSVEEGQRLTLEGVKPGIPRLGLAFVAERETLYQLVNSGQLDYAWSLPVERIGEFDGGTKQVLYSDLGYTFISFNPIDPMAIEGKDLTDRKTLEDLKKNNPHPILSDARVRKALVLGADRASHIKRFWKGHSTIPANPWHISKNTLTSNYEAEPYNPEEAARLLDEAGWKMAGDFRQKDGKTLEFSVLCAAKKTIFENYLLSIQQDYRKLGINVKIEQQEPGQYSQKAMTRQFDAICAEFKVSTRPDASDTFHSSSPYNFSSWIVDEKLEQVRDAPSIEIMQQGIADLETLFHQDLPIMILYSRLEVAAAAPYIHGHGNHLNALFGVEHWLKDMPDSWEQ